MKFNANSNKVSIQDSLKSDGYVVLENIYNDEDLSDIKKIFESHFKKNSVKHNGALVLPNASHIFPEAFFKLVCNKNLNNMLSKIFDSNYSFTSHSDMHKNLMSNWHKDDGRGEYFDGLPDYFSNGMCKVYKIGIYLFNSVKSGGLTVRSGSHKVNDLTTGQEIYISLNPRDIVLFDVRITHKGDFSYSLTNRIKRKLGFEINHNRLSCFFTFGLSNNYTRVFSEKNMNEQMKVLKNDSIRTMPSLLKSGFNSLNVSTFF